MVERLDNRSYVEWKKPIFTYGLHAGEIVYYQGPDYDFHWALIDTEEDSIQGLTGRVLEGDDILNLKLTNKPAVFDWSISIMRVYRVIDKKEGHRTPMKVNDFIEVPTSIDTETQNEEPNAFYYEERGGMVSHAETDDEVPDLSEGDLVAYRNAGGLTWVLAMGECRSGYVIHILPGSCPVLFSKYPAHLLEDEPMIVVSPNADGGFSPQSIATIIQDPDMLKRFYCSCNFDIAAREETFMAWFNPKF